MIALVDLLQKYWDPFLLAEKAAVSFGPMMVSLILAREVATAVVIG